MRIGIVHEQPRDAEMLRRAVELVPEYQVVWVARTGAEAVGLCARRPTDLVLLDVLISGPDVVETTRRIRAAAPCAILLVAGSVRANAVRVFEAMGHGALDAIDMPEADSPFQNGAAPLLAKIATISRLIESGAAVVRRRAVPPSAQHPLVAIGASAGGPVAVAAVLRGLPTDFRAAVVVIQHVEAQFALGMADWLGQQTSLPVALATEGASPAPGHVLVAGTGDHLALKTADRLGYTPEPRNIIYRPSIDVFFESVSRLWPGKAIGVLLTGMGRDGARGLQMLRGRGHHTIAQDEATSAVYGMPKAAVTLNAATEVLPVPAIAPRLVDLLGAKGAPRPS